ncbi:sortase [Enterococcus mundtii]|uniref:sortase n=1 Tax=Enterococcus mundtii TaxID=53346 RepID=UPI003B9842FE
MPSAELFTHIDLLKKGDYFSITILNKKFIYEVDQIMSIEPTDTEPLSIVKGKDYCSLITCTPYGINTHRLVIRGMRKLSIIQ